MEENCDNSGFYHTQEEPRKGIEIDGRRFIHDPSLYIGRYSEIESILEIEEPELYEGKDKNSIPNSLLSSSKTLFQIERAHLMDPDMVSDLLWKQGNLYNPKSDEVSLNLFPNLLKDSILIDEIPGFSNGKENDVGSILLEKVEGSDLNEDQKEDLLNLVSLYQTVFIDGIEGLPQTPLLEFRVELNDYSPLIQKPYVVGLFLEETMKRLIQQYVDAGFYIRGTSQYVSPAFVVVKPKKSDDTKLEKLKEYFPRNHSI
jgi:hypothetical protein